uniref:NADH dehydrogenese subunit 6 n=1 Tax=Bothropolys sp. SP-2004 TaxID=292347 RepID=A5D6K0_9MYRI|nr:NADH dehydrogenese subunit 6 [Bothropolys sp. SP-2004]
MLMISSMVITLLLTQITHPVSFIFTMIILSVLISLTLSSIFSTFWYGYILILVFLGGLLILFLYIASIAPNSLFPKVNISNIAFLLPLILIIYFSLNINHFIVPLKTLNFINTHLSKLYSQSSMITIFLIIYLLMTLLVVVKITNFNKGPLRHI